MIAALTTAVALAVKAGVTGMPGFSGKHGAGLGDPKAVG